jgi:hypothetical protein
MGDQYLTLEGFQTMGPANTGQAEIKLKAVKWNTFGVSLHKLLSLAPGAKKDVPAFIEEALGAVVAKGSCCLVVFVLLDRFLSVDALIFHLTNVKQPFLLLYRIRSAAFGYRGVDPFFLPLSMWLIFFRIRNLHKTHRFNVVVSCCSN